MSLAEHSSTSVLVLYFPVYKSGHNFDFNDLSMSTLTSFFLV
uniref:Uncharacterized protein n=1 Tax=Vibrio sp. FF_273 TaxID=1652830 RepID=A0A0H3ZX05_9VIBR|nr:hypothetical protein [Vibrio sp. FF_273]